MFWSLWNLLKIKNRKKFGESPSIWKLNTTLLYNLWVKERKSLEKLENILNECKLKQTYQIFWDALKQSSEGIYNFKYFY